LAAINDAAWVMLRSQMPCQPHGDGNKGLLSGGNTFAGHFVVRLRDAEVSILGLRAIQIKTARMLTAAMGEVKRLTGLFSTERRHRISLCRASRRNVTGDDGYGGQQQRHVGERQRSTSRSLRLWPVDLRVVLGMTGQRAALIAIHPCLAASGGVW
jgi:hypothetical protein